MKQMTYGFYKREKKLYSALQSKATPATVEMIDEELHGLGACLGPAEQKNPVYPGCCVSLPGDQKCIRPESMAAESE